MVTSSCLPSCMRASPAEKFYVKGEGFISGKKLGSVAYQRKELKFKAEYAELLDLLDDLPETRKWLKDHDFKLRSQAFDVGGIRWGSMTTNASEYFNDILKGSNVTKLVEIRQGRYATRWTRGILANQAAAEHLHRVNRHDPSVAPSAIKLDITGMRALIERLHRCRPCPNPSWLNTGTHDECVHLYAVEVVKRWMDDTYFQSEAVKSWMFDNDHPRKSRYLDYHNPIHQPRRLDLHLYET
ncbi:hypothetical protein QQ045_002709 [Rhodiola kirilowii]